MAGNSDSRIKTGIGPMYGIYKWRYTEWIKYWIKWIHYTQWIKCPILTQRSGSERCISEDQAEALMKSFNGEEQV